MHSLNSQYEVLLLIWNHAVWAWHPSTSWGSEPWRQNWFLKHLSSNKYQTIGIFWQAGEIEPLDFFLPPAFYKLTSYQSIGTHLLWVCSLCMWTPGLSSGPDAAKTGCQTSGVKYFGWARNKVTNQIGLVLKHNTIFSCVTRTFPQANLTTFRVGWLVVVWVKVKQEKRDGRGVSLMQYLDQDLCLLVTPDHLACRCDGAFPGPPLSM